MMTPNGKPATGHGLSDRDMAALGLQMVAYVKPVRIAGEDVFAVHAADGTEMAVMGDIRVALEMIRDNDLEAVHVH